VNLHGRRRLSEIGDEVFELRDLAFEFAFRMGFGEELFGGLTEIVDDVDACEAFDRIRYLFQVD